LKSNSERKSFIVNYFFSGAYSIVKKIVDRKTGKKYAVKIINKYDLSDDDELSL
jgi:hypothetical protein